MGRQIGEAPGSRATCANFRGAPRWATRLLSALLLLSFIAPPMLFAAHSRSHESVQNPSGPAQPEVRIPVTGMGYLPPGDLPAFYGYAEVSLHFVDATHLLFVFRIPRLLRRGQLCSGAGMERVVRAVVIELPSGKIQKMTEWKLYDFDDFLWGLGNGQFLFRQCNRFDLLDASLEPQPLIEASGSIESIRFSPHRSLAVIEQASGKTGSHPASPSLQGKVPRNVDVEFVQFHPLKVIARARLQTPGHIPILDDGFLEVLPASHHRWVIELHPFQGAERKIATVRSRCVPWLTPLSDQVIVARVCSSGGDVAFEGYDRQGLLLWRIPKKSDASEPWFLLTRDGAHFAIESLDTRHTIGAFEPLNHKNVRGEKIEVYDTLTGTAIGGLLVQPEYTAGRNADFSPDGKRIAVLNRGAIEIYSLKQLRQDR